MKIFSLLTTTFLLVLFYLLSSKIPEENIRLALNRVGLWAPLVFIFLTLLTEILAPLSSMPLIFAGFYAFGTNVVFLMMFAALCSYIINFWIARRWGRKLVVKFVGHKNIGKIDKLTKSYGLATLLFLRIFQGGIGDFVSYAAGLTSLQFFPYLGVSIIVAIPKTILWYLLARQVETPLTFTLLTLIMVVVFSAAFILLTLFSRKRKR